MDSTKSISDILNDALRGKEIYFHKEGFFINGKKLHDSYTLHEKEPIDFGDSVSIEHSRVSGTIEKIEVISEKYEADGLIVHIQLGSSKVEITTYSLQEKFEFKN